MYVYCHCEYVHAICIGTPALTSRTMNEDNIKEVSEFLVEGIKIAQEVEKKVAEKEKPTVKAFFKYLDNDAEAKGRIDDLRRRVEEFALKFPIPGYDDH